MTWGMMWHCWRTHYHKWTFLPKIPFHFMWCSRLPSKWSVSPEDEQINPSHEDWIHYCIKVRLTLREGGGDQPPPSHAWTNSLMTDIFQNGLEERITEAVVLAPRMQSYYLDDDHTKRGSLFVMQGILDSACPVQFTGPRERLRCKQW